MNITHPSVFFLYGAGGSGKTSLIKYRVRQGLIKGLYDFVVVFTSPSTKADGDYDWVQPQKYVVTKNYAKVLQNIIDEQGADNSRRGVVIFDDVTGQINWEASVGDEGDQRSKCYYRIATEWRHLNLSVMIAIHYVYKIPPTLREATNECAIYKQTTKRSIVSLHDTYGQQNFPKYADFMNYLNNNTKEFQFLFWQKAPPPGAKNFVPMKCPHPLPEFVIDMEKGMTIGQANEEINEISPPLIKGEVEELARPNMMKRKLDQLKETLGKLRRYE